MIFEITLSCACTLLFIMHVYQFREMNLSRSAFNEVIKNAKDQEAERFMNVSKSLQYLAKEINEQYTNFHLLKNKVYELREEIKMDKEIRKIEKENKKEGKALKRLEKADKKRDKVCDYGEKMMKKGKKK